MVISVVVPIYKSEAFLGRCVDSILAQTFKDFELILVDDGSPDQCGAICDEYAKKEDRIRVVHQKNGGAAAARNAGIDVAAGAWIAFVDSDDWVHPDYLRVLYNVAVQQSADIVACRYETVCDDSTVDDTPVFPVISQENKEEYWIGDRTGATVPWGKLYRRELFKEQRYPVGRTAEDEYVTYKLLFECNKLVIIDNKLYRYYANNSSVSRNNYIQRLPDALEAFREHEEYFKDSIWQKAYRLEVECYAEAWSEAIWMIRKLRDKESKKMTAEYRAELRKYMETHKHLIPMEKRKDIYISAYPLHEWFIRGFGYLKGRLSNE